ncbi:hypothetical protein GW17_00001987 [Ensete ventricosum]|uniref:Uncharacterized protein n=1 Tax=Ensete ventricosum TaxID=4639 RepID=A0A444GEK0_ENSVE|nr:hypothetical protein B296_00025593 [Ensete ventricosum]RWW33297.1 hypothetical protein GW17_00001987 [Ensete ventricosum]
MKQQLVLDSQSSALCGDFLKLVTKSCILRASSGVIILARESGLKLELSDIPVQSLVPEPLRVLRYVGVVDAVNEKGRVELRRYKREHPFAQLSGSDNIIAFTTTRYKNQPLIVRGPGAGAEVTAGGVFSDILRLASYLGAPS